MHHYCGNIHTTNSETINLCFDIANELNITWTFWKEISGFLLDFQDNDYDLAVFDFNEVTSDDTNWVTLLRKQRPKLPVIVFYESIAPEFATELYSAKVFYLGPHPLDKATTMSIIESVSKCERPDSGTSS